jgi:DNA modification methylase
MGGEKAAQLTLTDPPYNVGVDYGAGTDDRRSDYAEWSQQWFDLCPSGCVVLTPGIVNVSMWYVQIKPPKWICAWRKVNQVSNSGIGGFNTWEPLLVYGKVPKHVGHDSWDMPVQQMDVAHPVAKTLKAWSQFVDSFSTDGATLYEPFGGSGTTLVACENLGRKCRAIEISPAYCAVILERMAQAFPKLEITRDDGAG